MGTARDPGGKKIDYGDILQNNMRNSFHFAMTGRMLPQGKEGGEFVKDMAPIWHMTRMQKAQKMQEQKRAMMASHLPNPKHNAAANARYAQYVARVKAQQPGAKQ